MNKKTHRRRKLETLAVLLAGAQREKRRDDNSICLELDPEITRYLRAGLKRYLSGAMGLEKAFGLSNAPHRERGSGDHRAAIRIAERMWEDGIEIGKEARAITKAARDLGMDRSNAVRLLKTYKDEVNRYWGARLARDIASGE